jgi:tRNA pseudouridine55 synthase
MDSTVSRRTIEFTMELFGILNVNKPPGPTSRAMVDRVERLVRPSKAGHAGTLDPLASGVLVICVGRATRLIQYVQRMPKTYRATFVLGKRSETDDVESASEDVPNAVAPATAAIDASLSTFVGEIEQRPPAHSAVKVAGKRAYELARRGAQLELKSRTIQVHRIQRLEYEYPNLEVEIVCGSGTYVRSIGRDLGNLLGTGAIMSALVRSAIGKFRLEDSLSPEELDSSILEQYLQSPQAALTGMPHATLSEAQLIEIQHGRPILKSWLAPPENMVDPSIEIAAIDDAGRLAAILYEKIPGELWPRMSFTDSRGR